MKVYYGTTRLQDKAQCPAGCDYWTRKKTDLVDHINAKHIGHFLECEICGDLQTTPKNLNRHWKRAHNKQRG